MGVCKPLNLADLYVGVPVIPPLRLRGSGGKTAFNPFYLLKLYRKAAKMSEVTVSSSNG